jgi:FtsP/CotA-like multicopper oxidase with cupredoxin domain
VVPGDQDGGPHQIIQPGASWAPEFTVSQPAATLWFQLSDGSDLIQIASDGGLLSEPIPLKSIALSPGERAEVVIDFSAISDESIQLHSGGRPILDLHIKKPSQKRQPPLPEQLATIDPFRQIQTRPPACLNCSPWESPAPSMASPCHILEHEENGMMGQVKVA